MILHEGTCPAPQELTHHRVMEEEGLVGPAKHEYNTGSPGKNGHMSEMLLTHGPRYYQCQFGSLPIRNLMDCKENNYLNSIQLPHLTKPGGSFL